jgi:hypothetical protein
MSLAERTNPGAHGGYEDLAEGVFLTEARALSVGIHVPLGEVDDEPFPCQVKEGEAAVLEVVRRERGTRPTIAPKG